MPYLRAGSGSPLVFLPGIFGSHRRAARLDRWMRAGQIALMARHREVWWIGRRPGLPGTVDIAQLAAEYADTLRHQFDSQVDVIGVSTGGSISLQLAVDHPDVVGRLVVVSAAYRLGERGRLAQKRTVALLRAGRPKKAAAEFMSRLGSSPVERRAMSLAGLMLGRIVVGDDDPDFLLVLDAEDRFDLHGRLPEIAAPTLVIGGDSDGFYTADLFRETVGGIPAARLVLYPGVGHMTTQGNRRLAAEVEAFLGGISVPGSGSSTP